MPWIIGLLARETRDPCPNGDKGEWTDPQKLPADRVFAVFYHLRLYEWDKAYAAAFYKEWRT